MSISTSTSRSKPRQGAKSMEHTAAQNGTPEGALASVEADLEKLREDIIDLEEWLAAGRRPHPHAKAYIFRVDKLKITVHRPMITGQEILEKAGKVPAKDYILRQVFKGGRLEKIELHQ